MKFAIFFAGSGQEVSHDEFVYKDWAERLESHGYHPILCDGVGIHSKSMRKRFTGAGWAKIIQEAMNAVDAIQHGVQPEKVVVVGMSRGGVEAVICAHCLNDYCPETPVFVFAIDPVQGYHAINSGAFDMRGKRIGRVLSLGFKGSRDKLKERYRLKDDAPKTIPENVDMYLSVLSQFRGKNRGVMWGFTPQSPSLTNMIDKGQDTKIYELLGDHSSGVYSGKACEVAFKTSREIRSLVTSDMFYHWLLKKKFASTMQYSPLEVLDAYCKIAIDDLGGLQFDNARSGFSFLMASQNEPGRFTNAAGSRFLKGRGHLIESKQVAESKKYDQSLHGYYVNERHFEVYREIQRIVVNGLKSNHSVMKLYPNIEPWLEHNRRGFK